MHPFHNITMAHQHVADMQATAERHRLVRRARRTRRTSGARKPAPGASAETIPFPVVTAPNARRPAA